MTKISVPNLPRDVMRKCVKSSRKLQKVVSGIAKRDGYTYVFNDRVMIYGEPEFNITEEVLKTLNDSYTKK